MCLNIIHLNYLILFGRVYVMDVNRNNVYLVNIIIFISLLIMSCSDESEKQEVNTMDPIVAKVYERPPRFLKYMKVIENSDIIKCIEEKYDHWAYFLPWVVNVDQMDCH